MKSWRAPKACEGCGFVRTVLVRERLEGHPTGRVGQYGQIEHEFVVVGESYQKHCRGCELEAKARYYDKLASENRKRAQIERTRQVMRRLKEHRE